MSTRNWVVTHDQMLRADDVARLYAVMSDARDLALQRKKNFVHIRDYFILKILLETGLRVFELVALKVGDFSGNALIVRHGKGNKKRAVLLTEATQKVIKQFMKLKTTVLREPIDLESPLFRSERKGPYTTRGIRKRVKFWFAKCRINPGLSCHSCRHTYISHLMAGGVDPITVRDNAGHSSLAVTSIYSHAIKDDLGEFELYSSEFKRMRNCTTKKGSED